MRRRKPHPALLIPEVLLIIFKHITNDVGEPLLPTLAAIARTCRLFQRQAEVILWDKLASISTLFNILPPRVRNKESRSWSLNRRMFSGPDWTRFLDRGSRVHVLIERTSNSTDERRSSLFPAIAALRDPILLTPNLRKLEWYTNHTSLHPAINLFISHSLESLEIDAKLIVNRVIRVPLADTCPKLKHLKINGNARSSASVISSILRGLHYLETVACSTLDNDAFVHLAQSTRLSYLAVDMRWSILNLDALSDRLLSDSFPVLHTLCWKDYDLDALTDMFLLDISPSTIHLEIESFCTPSSTRAFSDAFAAKFPHTRALSLVHDVGAGRRYGLQARAPRREHHLSVCDLHALLTLPLCTLTLVDLGMLCVDALVWAVAGALPGLEHLQLGACPVSCVTVGGLVALLEGCPALRTLGVCVDVGDVRALRDARVRNDHVTHLRVEGRGEVDALLRRVMPGLRTVEESVDGVTWHVREVGCTKEWVSGGGRRTRRL